MTDTWPFQDDPDTAALTVPEILDRSRAVLYVVHDVDGTWQFLTGDEVESDAGTVVSLADIVARDASLTPLSDLPYGWEASRSEESAGWDRRSRFPTEWPTLIEGAMEFLEEQQNILLERFAIESLERFEYDREASAIRFFADDDRSIVAHARVVGSQVDAAGLWVWAWANESIEESEHEDMIGVAAFGAQHGFEKLHSEGWPADEYDAWEMTAIAAMLLEAEGAYCAPHEGGAVYMILADVRLEDVRLEDGAAAPNDADGVGRNGSEGDPPQGAAPE